MKKPNKLLNNIGLKILAVLFSALLWMVAMNINDPVEKKTFRDMTVEFKNTGVLSEEGKTWQVLDESDTVTVTVRASRSVLDNLNASDITATADFSELSFTNTVPIRLSVNRYVENQIQEISGSIDNLKLDVEDLVERQLVIGIVQVGEPAEEYIVGKVSTTDGNALKISGPESVVSQVKKAVVEADVEGLTDNINITEKIKLLNEAGEEVTDSRIIRSVSTANVSVTILRTKTVPISLSTMGEPASGYVATGEISCAPEVVTIAGKSSAVTEIESIVIPATELDLTGATADVTKLIDVRNYLPDGISLVSSPEEEFNGKAAVLVQIEPLVEITVEVDKSKLQFRNVPSDYEITPDPDSRVTIRLRGLQEDLDSVDADNLVGTVDVAEWLNDNDLTEPEEGEQEMEASFQLPDEVTQVASVKVAVNIEKITQNVHGQD